MPMQRAPQGAESGVWAALPFDRDIGLWAGLSGAHGLALPGKWGDVDWAGAMLNWSKTRHATRDPETRSQIRREGVLWSRAPVDTPCDSLYTPPNRSRKLFDRVRFTVVKIRASSPDPLEAAASFPEVGSGSGFCVCPKGLTHADEPARPCGVLPRRK